MMNRREFVKFIAVTTAASGLPEQIKALERYYEVNTPAVETGLVSIDQFFISGRATCSTVTRLAFWSGGNEVMRFSLNLFGGAVRWVAAPDQKMIVQAKQFIWRVEGCEPGHFDAQISYIDQDAKRHTKFLETLTGALA